MLTDNEYNALDFQETEDIHRLVGKEIIDVEPVTDGVMCGVVLFLKCKDGALDVVVLDAPGYIAGDTTFSIEIASIKEEPNERV